VKKSLLSLSFLLMLSACVTDSNAVKDYERDLQWVSTADAQADALAALAAGDFRLMAVPGRGEVIPGIEASKRNAYSLKCGTRLIPGMTDAVIDDSHLRLLKKASEYGARYNSFIIEKCIP
jgi:hypothetical protein